MDHGCASFFVPFYVNDEEKKKKPRLPADSEGVEIHTLLVLLLDLTDDGAEVLLVL